LQKRLFQTRSSAALLNGFGVLHGRLTVPIATGIGEARNAIIARAALALLAVGGGYGTLSEIALALQFGRPVLTLLDAPVVPGVRSMMSVDAALDTVCSIVLALPD